MPGVIVSIIVGIVCIVIGITNMRGNISSLHSYHRERVSDEDVIPFGRLVGLGTIIVGAGVILFSILTGIAIYTANDALTLIGTAVMIVAIVVGLGISIYAMKKYNKGVF